MNNLNRKYKQVYELALEYLNTLLNERPELKNDFDRQMKKKPSFKKMSDVTKRLFLSMSNRNMMRSVIGYKDKEKKLAEILMNYDPSAISAKYPVGNENELFVRFKKSFLIHNQRAKGNLWRQFASGIVSGSRFMASFKNAHSFKVFISKFSLNKFTKASLPMLLSKEVKGIGFALACDFLKELGYREYPKPDVHLIRIFLKLGLSRSKKPYEVYKSIVEMSEVVGKDAFSVDKIFWFISAKDHGNSREKFIKHAQRFIS